MALTASVQRVAAALERLHHPHAPVMLRTAARTAQQAADALGVEVGQIGKSIVFKRLSDGIAVLVVTAGDQRVDEAKVARLIGPIGRADAAFVKAQTGFSIGGVSPVAHANPVMTLLDESLQRFDVIWVAAGHPNGLFTLTSAQLEHLTGAPWAAVTLDANAAPR